MAGPFSSAPSSHPETAISIEKRGEDFRVSVVCPDKTPSEQCIKLTTDLVERLSQ